ncbi:Integral membrane protein SED5 [Microbotryomycetes sp. JL221]|nr:Integral membrane protein SED5 [Microbotryomycetes sp. JL221]
MSLGLKDRTNEFRACVESVSLRLTASNEHRKPLLHHDKTKQRSEFARMANKISKDIQGTTYKLEKLAQLAKRKTLFDDRPVEISELTYIIKQDIAALNQQIGQLQLYTKSQIAGHASTSKQVSEHNNNIVMMLQSKLADTSIGFKDVLEIRTQNMKASRNRTEQFMHTTSNVPTGPASVLRSRNPNSAGVDGTLRSDSPLYRSQSSTPSGNKGKGKDVNGGQQQQQQADFLALDLGGPGQAGSGQSEQGYMQMELAQQGADDQYVTQRSSAIETIESTVAELGQIFSQLATMVAVQGEVVSRIDADTEEIATNVSGAQNELLRYYASVSSNRWLMLKVFAALIFTFLVFVMVS